MLLLSKEAETDIQHAYSWYADTNPLLGAAFIHEVEIILTKIEQAPESYQNVLPQIRRALCRKFPYAVYFKPLAGSIIVFAVLHQRRHPSRWQKR